VLGFNLIWLIDGSADPVRLGSIMDAMLKVCSPIEQLLYRNVQRFRGGLVVQAHRRVYHSTLGLRVIKKKKVCAPCLQRERNVEKEREC